MILNIINGSWKTVNVNLKLILRVVNEPFIARGYYNSFILSKNDT